MTAIWHFDGIVATRRSGTIHADQSGFTLSITGVADERYAWDVLTHRGQKQGLPWFGHRERSGWQIGFQAQVPDEIAAYLPRNQRYGAWIDRFGLVPASAGLLAISAAVLGIILTAPRWIAPLVPQSWEAQIGTAMIGDFGGRFCNAASGKQALARLARAVSPAGASGGASSGTQIDVRVANIAMVNAVALPGGKVIIFRGLIDEAKSADEVAGVLGHEIGHVARRHVMQALIRQAGLSILTSGVGGDFGGYADVLIGATYSREAETQADAYAINALRGAQIAPDGTADFFKRLGGGEKSLGRAATVLGYLSSHPLSEQRERAFRSSRTNTQTNARRYVPALSATEWQALRTICKDNPNVAKADGFPF